MLRSRNALEPSGLRLRRADRCWPTGSQLGGDLFLSGGAWVGGELRLVGANHCGRRQLHWVRVRGHIVQADGLSLGGDLFLSGGVRVGEDLRLLGATIAGDVSLHWVRVRWRSAGRRALTRRRPVSA